MAEGNPNVILAGTAPNSGEAIRQNNADQAALASSGTDLASKQNILATQMLSAAAGTGNQHVWDATLNHLKSANIDTSAIPTDVKQGADWAQSGRLAQSPLGSLLNTTTKMDSNSNAAAIAGGNVPNDPNAATHSLLRSAVVQQYGPAGGTLYDNHVSAGGKSIPPHKAMTPDQAKQTIDVFDPAQTTGNVAPNATAATPAGAAPVAGATPQGDQNAQATISTIQQNFAGMNPRDQARITSVTQGAEQLQPFLLKGDTQGAMNFLQQRRAELLKQGGDVDTQDTDAAIQMLQSGQVDQLKQQVNSILAYGAAVNQGQQKQGQGAPAAGGDTPAKFVPPKYDPSKTQAANQAAYTQALETFKADPVNVRASGAATAQGAEDVKAGTNAANTTEMYNKLYQNLEAMRKLVPDMPQQGLILSADDQASISQRAGKNNIVNDVVGDNQKASNAVKQWDMINHAQILNGLTQLMSTGGNIRSNKVIAGMVANGSGIPSDASPEAKNAMIDNLEAELRNTQAQTQNVKADVAGGQRQDYSNIPVQLSDKPAQGGMTIKRVK